MRKILIAMVVAGSMGTTQQALAQNADVMKVINQFVDGFNKGDMKSALAACADMTIIIDEFPPHSWSGAGACGKWAADYDAHGRQNGITDGIVTLTKPKHLTVTGDRAYAVIPSNYEYKEKGKPVKQTGSIFTFVVQKGAAGWKIVAWSWSTN